MKQFILAILITFPVFLFGQTCVGKWTTIDDETREKKSIVELYKVDGKLYGKIIYLYPRKGLAADPKCTECTDDRKNQSIEGMQIIRGMVWDGSEWESGTILDPKIGKIYSAKLWLNSKNSDYLNVRGYSGPFYRTQTWVRVKD